MTRDELFAHLLRNAIIGVVREDDADDAWEIARTYAENGLRSIEITMTTPDALALVGRLVNRYGGGGLVVAAGTVRSTEDAAAARRAGAQVIVSPHTDFRVIDYATEHDLIAVAGASTPTEIVRAWEGGAAIVKVYPAALLGGPDYIRTIRQPIRDIPMLAGGPVPLEMIDAYLDAGCVALNLGASLSVPELVRAGEWGEIGRRVTIACSTIAARRAAAGAPLIH